MTNGAHGDVLDQIGRRIAAGELAAGTVITVAELEAEYGVSRTVIRETIRVLESIRMVHAKRRVGITVRPTSDWDAFDAHLIRWNLTGPRRQAQLETLIELRAAIEPTAARLAALRASHAQGSELARLADELDALGQKSLGDSEQYLELDVAFHRLLLVASDNPMFVTVAAPICETLRGRAALGLTPAVPAPSAMQGHLGTARAVRQRDPDAAEQCTRAYISTIWQEIVES